MGKIQWKIFVIRLIKTEPLYCLYKRRQKHNVSIYTCSTNTYWWLSLFIHIIALQIKRNIIEKYFFCLCFIQESLQTIKIAIINCS